MKKFNIKEWLDNQLIKEETTYRDLSKSLEKAFNSTGVTKHIFDNKVTISASGWSIGHPNGSIGVTFWLMDDKVSTNKLKSTAKKWAKDNDLIASTFYPKGIKPNDKASQDWNNKSSGKANFVYGFTFYKPNFQTKSIYTPL